MFTDLKNICGLLEIDFMENCHILSFVGHAVMYQATISISIFFFCNNNLAISPTLTLMLNVSL